MSCVRSVCLWVCGLSERFHRIGSVAADSRKQAKKNGSPAAGQRRRPYTRNDPEPAVTTWQ
ncbi:hypothetical protein DESC_350023 [Desulfosarcina cetonica]|nr:hypothetical protein DESC_350023 [Desulfosarcina cetonica]